MILKARKAEVIVVLVALFSSGVAWQSSGQGLRSPKVLLHCKVTLDSDKWTKGGQMTVHILIENASETDVQLNIIPALELTKHPAPHDELKRAASTYWAPIDLTGNKPLETDRQIVGGAALVIKPRIMSLKLSKASRVEFRVDAAGMEWARSISSVWPHQKLFEVVANGNYDLAVVLESDKRRLHSNSVAVSIQN